MTNKTRPVYGLLIHTKDETDKYYNNEATLTVTLAVVKVIEGRKLRNPSTTDGDELADFKVREFINEKYDFVHPEGAFFDAYKVEKRDAKRMLKVYNTLDKNLAKQSAKFGSAQSFGAQVARIAAALGIEYVIRQETNGGSNYDDSEYRFSSIGDGVYILDRIVADWREKHPLPVKTVEEVVS